MRKETSKNLENEQEINSTCGLAYTLSLIGGRWKPSILWRLLPGSKRYNELKKSLPNISERILILQLRELEADGLISRTIYPVVPPKVDYELTPLAHSLTPVFQCLSDWGIANRPKGG